MIGNGIHSLNNPGVQTKVNNQAAAKLATELEDLKKKRVELLAKTKKVKENREAKGRGEVNGFVNWDA
jgi:hypothetical protein